MYNDFELILYSVMIMYKIIRLDKNQNFLSRVVNKNKEDKVMKFRCTICGHIYDEDVEGVKFEDLPSDWVCPLCGVGKDMFEKVD